MFLIRYCSYITNGLFSLPYVYPLVHILGTKIIQVFYWCSSLGLCSPKPGPTVCRYPLSSSPAPFLFLLSHLLTQTTNGKERNGFVWEREEIEKEKEMKENMKGKTKGKGHENPLGLFPSLCLFLSYPIHISLSIIILFLIPTA